MGKIIIFGILYCFQLMAVKVTLSMSLVELGSSSVKPTPNINLGSTVNNGGFVELGQSVVGNEDEWLRDPEYPKEDEDLFQYGSYSLGAPKGHSCVEQSFAVINGRLICTQMTAKGVMCVASCKKQHLLQTGYEAGTSKSMSGVYFCHPNSMFWTDVYKNKLLPLPNPRCVPVLMNEQEP